MTPLDLTPRELEAARLVARSNRDIAAALGATPGTVKEYVDRALRKLGLPNRTALAVWARQQAEQ